MCDACMEMDLYFAYLSEVEARKQLEQQASQPWQCEVTVFPQDEVPPAPVASTVPAQAKSSFVCDEPE
jgi:hypothetical protein